MNDQVRAGQISRLLKLKHHTCKTRTWQDKSACASTSVFINIPQYVDDNNMSDINMNSRALCFTGIQQHRTVERSTQEDLPLQNGCIKKVPKVALLFLVQSAMPNEPIWRAFLEQASRMSLPCTAPLPPQTLAARKAASDGHTAAAHHEVQGSPARALQQNRKLGSMYKGMLPQEQDRVLHHSKRLTDETPACCIHNITAANTSTAGGGSAETVSQHMVRADAGQRQNEQNSSWGDFFSVYVHNTLGYNFPVGSIFHSKEVKGRVNTTKGWGQHALIEASIPIILSPPFRLLLNITEWRQHY
jgi:hypothetical protein